MISVHNLPSTPGNTMYLLHNKYQFDVVQKWDTSRYGDHHDHLMLTERECLLQTFLYIMVHTSTNFHHLSQHPLSNTHQQVRLLLVSEIPGHFSVFPV